MLNRDDLLTVAQTADRLNVSEPTIRRFTRDGVLPVVKLGGKAKSRIRIRNSDVDALIENGYRAATTGPLARK